MSLLMDALKKAELAKRQMQVPAQGDGAQPAPAGAPLSLAPLEQPGTNPSAPGSLPELPEELAILDAEFIAEAKRGATRKPAPPPASAPAKAPNANGAGDGKGTTGAAAADEVEAARQVARQVFEAKHPPAAGNRTFIATVGGLTLAAVIGIGIYFWLQLQPASRPATGPRGPAVAVSPPAPAAFPTIAAPANTPAPIAAVAPAIERPTLLAPAVEAPPLAESRPAARSAATPDPASPVRITRSRAPVSPVLLRAFDALDAGNLEAAQTDYALILKSEPKNPDALHGMAAVALRQGRHDVAEEFYLRAIEADPKNALAQAGLIGLRGQVDPVASESRLKNLIAAQPDQHFLQFALGNLHAAAGRWNEAQQAFFKAYTGDPEHPDYLYNLAVSLDHLRQPKLAAHYYHLALAAAGTRAAGFDKAQAGVRLRELQP